MYNRLALLWNSLPYRLRISRSRAEFKSTMWKLLAERDFNDRCVTSDFLAPTLELTLTHFASFSTVQLFGDAVLSHFSVSANAL